MTPNAMNTTGPQQEIWLAAELGGAPAFLAYQDTLVLDLEGQVDEDRFALAWDAVVRRHGSLQGLFSSDGTALRPGAAAPASWDRIEGPGPSDAWEGFLGNLTKEESGRPLELVRGPAYRTLWAAAPGRQAFVLTVHRLVADAASQKVILDELAAEYLALTEGRTANLPAAPQFAEYAGRLEKTWESEDDRSGRSFWGPRLREVEALDLPTDFRRPPVRGWEAHSVDLLLTALPGGRLPEPVVLAAFAVFVSRLCGQPMFALGWDVAGQPWYGIPGTVGHCVHTLPMAVRIEPEERFDELAARIGSDQGLMAARAPVSLRDLFQTLGLPRDPSRVPLVPVRFSQSPGDRHLGFGPAKGVWRTAPRRYDASELALDTVETDGGLLLRLTYQTGLIDPRTAEAWAEDLRCLLTAAAASPGTLVRDLPSVSEHSRHLLFSAWNTPVKSPDAPGTALTLFEEQAAKTPGAPAVSDAREAFSYRQLDELANALAQILVDRGVVPGDLVGVCVGRSARMVAALLGIWKAGAAYVPLDPDYPRDRLAYIAEDSRIAVLVTERPLADVFGGHPLDRIWLDESGGRSPLRPPRPDDPRQLAYVLHTSGSTGRPKGVQIEHRSLVNFLGSFAALLTPGTADTLVATTTLSFDIAGLELFLPLCTGAQVAIASREDSTDGFRLSQLLDRSSATLFQATPSTWHLLVEAGWRGPPGFKALCGGEAFPPDLARQLLERCGSVWNVYGPTETTIWSTISQVTADEAVPSIGRPIDNTTVYIADSQMRPVPIGAAGELLIGGLGLARGYLNRPDLTAERFLEISFRDAGERVYRTGDLCRFGADGRIHFLRRNDSQVKVRGFRIELGEIDNVAGAFPGVRQAVTQVCRFGENDLRLATYLTAQPGTALDLGALKTSLQTKLPGYMVPQHFLLLDEFPLTPNGKIDRKALVLPESEALPDRPVKEPRTGRERTLLALWKELLKTEHLGTDDNFFDVGGHSLLAAKMTARIRDTMSVDISMRTVFQTPTVEGLAAWMEAAQLSSRRASHDESPREEVEF